MSARERASAIPVQIETLPVDQILADWGRRIGPNPPFVESAVLSEPFSCREIELTKTWKWDLKNNPTHLQLASLMVTLATLDAKFADTQRRDYPKLFLTFDGGKWTAEGWRGRYYFHLTLGTAEITASYDFTIVVKLDPVE